MTILPQKKTHGQVHPPSLHSGTGGQALIILLLVMVIGLTIGLSVATRSTTDIRIATQHAYSQKAFSAAEAGIEDALRRDLGLVTVAGGKISSAPGGDAAYEVKVTAQGGGQTFATSTSVAQDDVAQIVLTPPSSPAPTGLWIYWINENDKSERDPLATPSVPGASLEITEVYLDGAEYKVKKYAVNPTCDTTSETGETNGFDPVNPDNLQCSSASNNVGGRTYRNRVAITLQANSRLLRFRPLYNKTSVAVQVKSPANATLPIQSYLIESTGIAGDVSRKLQVSRSLEALPSIFDYAIYSGTSLTK